MKKLLLLILALLINGCVYKKLKTFDDYCDDINGRNNSQTTLYVRDSDLIKEDFVKYYNNLILSDIAIKFLGGATVKDSAVQLCYEKGFIGVKQKENDLIITNNFLYSENDPILKTMNIPSDFTFKGFTDKFRNIFMNRHKRWKEMSEAQRCIFITIGVFYKRIIIEGPNNEKVEILNESFEN